jgi:hypothetical protein
LLQHFPLCLRWRSPLPTFRRFALPDPPGPHVGAPDPNRPPAADFREGTPLVATTYFYWYDAETKAHIVNHDGTDALTDHPPTLEGLSYKNIDWHATQLTDMMAAGIDVAMPVYWGSPAGGHGFSDVGLPPLVASASAADRTRQTSARDRFVLRHQHVAAQRRRIPCRLDHRCGPPLVLRDDPQLFLADSCRTSCDDRWPPAGFPVRFRVCESRRRATVPGTRKMFRRDFGTDLYLVKMDGWPGEADSRYQWGGALRPQLLETAGIGPGYDHSAVPGRTPLVRSRDEGRFYEFSWQRLLSRDPATRPWLVHVETWNEFHEGTQICETIEYGRQYIDATRKFADLFRERVHLRPADLQPTRRSGDGDARDIRRLDDHAATGGRRADRAADHRGPWHGRPYPTVTRRSPATCISKSTTTSSSTATKRSR